MKKLIIGAVTAIMLSTTSLAASQDVCLNKIRTFDKNAKITEIKKFDIIEYYHDIDVRRKGKQDLVNAACVSVLSKECVLATKTWGPVLKLYNERVTKMKSFALEADTTYYRIKTNLYDYVCAVSSKKSVVVVDN